MQIPSPVLHIAQRAVDSALSVDEHTARQLRPFAGMVVEVNIDAPATVVYALVGEDHITLSRFHDEPADVVVSGSPMALASLQRDSAALQDGRVSVSGDTAAAHKLAAIARGLDLAIEERLAELLGGTTAHQLVRAGREFSHLMGSLMSRAARSTGQQLTERDVLATTEQQQHWCDDVDSVRARADRVEARIAALEARLQPGNPAVAAAPATATADANATLGHDSEQVR